MNNATLQSRTARCLGIAILASILLSAASASFADSLIPSVPADGAVSAEQIEAAINAVSAREGLAEETRSAVIDQLRDAQAQLQNQVAAEAATEAFAKSLVTAPAQTEALLRELDEPTPEAPTAASLGIYRNTPVDEVESLLSRRLAEVAGAEARLSELESQVTGLEERPAAARQRINELRTARDRLEAQIDAAPPPGEVSMLSDARRLAAELRLDARTAELSRLEQELASHGARLALVRAQRDIAARNLARLREEAAVLQVAANERRQSAAEQALQEAALAELAAADSHPVVRTLAEGNAELTRELPAVVADL